MARTQKRDVEGSRAKTCTKRRSEGSVSKVVAQIYSGDEEGPARRNPARKTLPAASVAAPRVREKKSLFRVQRRAQQAQQLCRGVGGNMGQVGLKIGARPWPVRRAGIRQVVVTKEEKHRP